VPVESISPARRKTVCIVSAICSLLLCSAALAQSTHTLTGDIRYHTKFHSRFLNNDRDVIVYLPPGYAIENAKRYAVLYLHDGQNLFDGATSFIPGQEWRVDETAQELILGRKIEPLIIVGVYNTGNDRIDEYTPVRDPEFKAGGRADLYGRFLVEELKPFIDNTYRTRKDSAHTGLGGSSLGGLISLYLGLKYPDVFGKLAVVSPSVWWADKQIVKYVAALPRKSHSRIWLDTGTKEGRNAKEAQGTVDDARLLKAALLKKGWRDGKDVKYLEAEAAEHNEAAWAARTAQILEFLFPK
jgi:predicted alpha/beta superfamily hydrolase